MVVSNAPPGGPRLMIPGPTEYDQEVLSTMASKSDSHVGAIFIKEFQQTLARLKKIVQSANPQSQPFLVCGSGTMGWDMVASNLCTDGTKALVISTGLFGDRFADCLQAYQVATTVLRSPDLSRAPSMAEIQKALELEKYEVVTITHVDTSTAIRIDLKAFANLVRRIRPECLIVVDAVCSLGAEDIRFDEWDLDFVHSASQKALGSPTGLCVMVASERSMKRYESISNSSRSYYMSWKNWLPIMKKYEAGEAGYFATPPTQLIRALNQSLEKILSRPLPERFSKHREASEKVWRELEDLGLKLVATNRSERAHTLTAFYIPGNVKAQDVQAGVLKHGVTIAGGILPALGHPYLRMGHMGVSVTDPALSDIDLALNALRETLTQLGHGAQ